MSIFIEKYQHEIMICGTIYAHFEAVVARMNEELQTNNPSTAITINMDEEIDGNNILRKNFGYAAPSKIYHELEIDKFLLNRQRNLDIQYSLNNIMKNEMYL